MHDGILEIRVGKIDLPDLAGRILSKYLLADLSGIGEHRVLNHLAVILLHMIASVLKIFFSFVSYCVKQKIG